MPLDRAPWEPPGRPSTATRRAEAAASSGPVSGGKLLHNPVLLAGVGGGALLLVLVIALAAGRGDPTANEAVGQPGATPSAPPAMHQRVKEGETSTRALNEFRAMCESILPMINAAYEQTGRVPTKLTGHPNAGGCNIPERGLTGRYVRFEDSVRSLGKSTRVEDIPLGLGNAPKVGLTARPIAEDKTNRFCTFTLGGNWMELTSD